MSIQTTVVPSSEPDDVPMPDSSYSNVRLALGVLGRMWLWFVAACLAITFIPILFGWRPYLIESGSMQPRIHVGDVVLSGPVLQGQDVLGKVIVFNDPDLPGRNKVHRVVAIDPQGDLITKGDANPTNDNMRVAVDQVHGLGRLLVKYVGLPLIWLQTGQWLWLLLFLSSLIGAVAATSRDHEDDEDTDEADDDPDDGEPFDRRSSASGGEGAVRRPSSLALIASGFDRRSRLHTWRTRSRTRRGVIVALLLAGVQILLLSTASAAFSATTSSPRNNWALPNWDYTTQVKALRPYLYWKLDETASNATAAADSSGNTPAHPGTYSPSNGFTHLVGTGALTSDAVNNAVTLTSTSSCIYTAATTAISAPAAVTVVAWFKTTPGYASGGKLFGFENPQTSVAIAGSGGTYDRMLYMDGNGEIHFGVYNGGYDVVSSAAGLNNGAWHMAVGTLGSGGMSLYIDGSLVGTNANNAGELTTGFWRAGCGNLAGWSSGWTGGNAPSSDSGTAKNFPFTGSLDELTVFNSALTASQISFLYFTR